MSIIKLIAAGPCSVEEICDRLRPRQSKETVNVDIAWLSKTFPECFNRGPARGRHGKCRVAFTWTGDEPYLLQHPITWLDENELLALVAARGLLRDADPTLPATSTTLSDHDLLATAVSRFLDRIGVEASEMLGRSVVTVSRFGAAQTDPACLSACLSATATAEAIECEYLNLKGEKSQRHLSPQRLLLVKGEWYVVAWDQTLKVFRIERMANAKRRKDHPPGKPVSIPSHEVDSHLQDAFYATMSSDPKQRKKVVLLVSGEAWPLIKGRRWGADTKFVERPANVPDGWKRVSFVTTGLGECRHWVLGMGATVRVEEPQELRQWIADQAAAVLASARQ